MTWLPRDEQLFDDSGSNRWIEHPLLGDKCDIGLLPLINDQGVTLADYGNGDFKNVEIGVTERVSVVGFPLGISGGGSLAVWCTGYIASEPTQDYAGQSQFLIDCRTRKGQSGSPVIAFRTGSFTPEGGGFAMSQDSTIMRLGIYTGRVHADADLGIVWKWGAIDDIFAVAELE